MRLLHTTPEGEGVEEEGEGAAHEGEEVVSGEADTVKDGLT